MKKKLFLVALACLAGYMQAENGKFEVEEYNAIRIIPSYSPVIQDKYYTYDTVGYGYQFNIWEFNGTTLVKTDSAYFAVDSVDPTTFSIVKSDYHPDFPSIYCDGVGYLLCNRDRGYTLYDMNKNFIKDSLTIFVDVEKNYQEASIVSSDNPPIFSTIPHWDVLPYSATGYVFRYGYRDYVSFSLEDDCRRLVSNQIGLQIIEPIANNRVIKISSDQYSMTYYRKYREPYPRSGIFVWSPTESDTMMFQYEPFSQFGGDFIPVPMIYDLQSE